MSAIEWHDIVGLLGVSTVLASYLGLQAGRLQAHGLPYQVANILGSMAILISLMYNFNLSGFIIQIAWIAISVYGILRVISRKRSQMQQ